MKLKTRTNQPVYYKLPVSSNIQSLSDDLLNSLRVGDVVQKKTGNQKHCYVVTYKEEKHGICLTYVDCGYMETISYDYTDGHWVFNSKDVCEVATKDDVKLENIKDKDGHNRFIGDDITLNTITGVTKTYGKWSLSGTHLLVVLQIAIEENTTINNGVAFANITLPNWIYDKIIPVYNVFIESPTFPANAPDYTIQNFQVYLAKTDGTLRISKNNNITIDKDREVRMHFDLLIDND